ncbi:MAG: glycosyltransferase family 2 protein [Flavobacteriales bacterium]|nr:glycosyltransferase family 2 protein [Flavobacteriales bacterium]
MGLKVSVVVPVHNKAPYLEACFDSIFRQTFAGFEVVAVDDASTDGSLALLRSFKDPRLRVERSERNSGPAAAAQQAMDLAHGEYIVRVDADDVMDPERIALQVAFMDARPEVDIAGTYYRRLEDGTIVKRPVTHEECLVELLFGVAVLQTTSILRRSSLVRHDVRYGSDWPHYAEDWMFQAKAAKHLRYANLDAVTMSYRTSANGVSSGRDRAAELPERIAFAFEQLGWPVPSDEQMDLHLMALNIFRKPVDARTVLAMKAWLDGLVARNVSTGRFGSQALQQRLDRIWDDLLFALPRYGRSPVLAYQKAGGRMSLARWYYVFRTLLSR